MAVLADTGASIRALTHWEVFFETYQPSPPCWRFSPPRPGMFPPTSRPAVLLEIESITPVETTS